MRRREVVKLAGFLAVNAKLADEIVSGVVGKDENLLATVQTSHHADLAIASLIEPPGVATLRRWMREGGTPILRVNACGIVAKLSGHDPDADVDAVLANDAEVRRLYMNAVVARVCGVSRRAAARVVASPHRLRKHQASFLAAKLTDERRNPRDAGARWCSDTLLRDLRPILG